MVFSDRMLWKVLIPCIHLLYLQLACYHLLAVLLIGFSCAFHAPSPIPGYDLLFLLYNKSTGLSDTFIRPNLTVTTAVDTPHVIPQLGPEIPVMLLAWTHLSETPNNDHVSSFGFVYYNSLAETIVDSFDIFDFCFSLNDAVVTLVQLDEVTYLSELELDPFGNFSMVQNSRIEGTHENVCSLMYFCLFRTELFSSGLSTPPYHFYACLKDIKNLSEDKIRSATWRCYIHIRSDEYEIDDYNFDAIINENVSKVPCSDESYDLTQTNWMHWEVDYNLQISLKGGVDTRGVYWEGERVNESFAETIGRQFWNLRGVKCTRANPCLPDLDCTRIGSYTALALGSVGRPLSLAWVLLATSAIKNINQQLVNQYDQLEHAIESLALDTFTIDDFFPKRNQNPSLQNSLTGLSGIFTILGGFIPVGGPVIEAAGTIASSIGTFLANSVPPSDPAEAQAIFSQKVLVLYRGLLSAMENVLAKLFDGDELPVTPSSGLSIAVCIIIRNPWRQDLKNLPPATAKRDISKILFHTFIIASRDF